MKSHLKNLIQINGAIRISQFMNEALFHPQLGYYNKQNPFGKDGDFTTSPEISQVFGELIGAYLLMLWQNNYQNQKINLVEMGAGRGTLMKDLLGFAKNIPSFEEKFNVSIIEISPRLQEVQKKNLKGYKINWYKDFNDFYQQNNDAPIFFISNELFDCFAINQFVKTKDGWAEKMVGMGSDGELQFVLRETILPEFANDSAEIDDIFEESNQAQTFMEELSRAIKETNGIGIIVDYGYIKSTKNTLQALKNHKYADVLKEAGEADLTALVDFSVLQNIALKNNLKNSLITQREFLTALGVEERKDKLLEGKTIQKQQEIASAIDRLTDPKQMGDLFKVLIIWP